MLLGASHVEEAGHRCLACHATLLHLSLVSGVMTWYVIDMCRHSTLFAVDFKPHANSPVLHRCQRVPGQCCQPWSPRSTHLAVSGVIQVNDTDILTKSLFNIIQLCYVISAHSHLISAKVQKNDDITLPDVRSCQQKTTKKAHKPTHAQFSSNKNGTLRLLHLFLFNLSKAGFQEAPCCHRTWVSLQTRKPMPSLKSKQATHSPFLGAQLCMNFPQDNGHIWSPSCPCPSWFDSWDLAARCFQIRLVQTSRTANSKASIGTRWRVACKTAIERKRNTWEKTMYVKTVHGIYSEKWGVFKICVGHAKHVSNICARQDMRSVHERHVRYDTANSDRT